MRTALIIVMLAALSCSASAGEIIKSGSFQASSDGNNVTLRWATEDESRVTSFEVERRTGSEGTFRSIASLDAKGPSSYEFIDYSAVLKVTTVYQYRLKILFSNGISPIYTNTLTVSHAVSGVRRTWGSIKAMFR